MAVVGSVERAPGEERWYSLSGEEVTSRLGVDPTVGLSGQRAAELIIVAAYQSRAVSLTALASATFDNRAMNLTAAAEVALAVLATQTDAMNRLLGTVPLDAGQFGLALAGAVLLFALWEGGKLLARHREAARS